MFRRRFDEDEDLYGPRPSRLARAFAWAGRPAGWVRAAAGGVGWAAGLPAHMAGRAFGADRAGRRWSHALLGLPALAAGVTLAAFAGTGGVRARDLAAVYRAAADRADAEDRPGAAVLYLRRLVQEDGGAPRTRFRLAKGLAATGRGDAAAGLLAGLTAGGVGYAPAHRLLAERLLAGPADGGPVAPGEARARVEAAFRHLALARASRPGDAGLAADLAALLLANGQDEDALPLIRQAAAERPELRLDEAAAARLGDAAAARRALAAAAEYFEEALAGDPADPVARARLARVRLLQFDAGEGAAADRLELLEDALRLAPGDPRALLRLIEFADGGSGEGAADALRTALDRGDVPAAAHLSLGTRAWAAGDEGTATIHLEEAHRLDPALGPAANNLAWVLAHRGDPEPDLDRALKIIDPAVARSPDVPDYRDTRGSILLLLGRPAEALADLNRVLAAGRDSADLRGRLAAAHDALAHSDEAARHRRAAEELIAADGPAAADGSPGS